MVPERQLTLLIGKPGVGKSMFAMDVIARSIRSQRGLSDLEQLPEANTAPEPGAERLIWQTSGKLAKFDRTKTL